MDDEEWVIEDPSTAEPEPAPVAEAPAEAAAEPEPEAAPVQEGPKKLLFKHWVRPKFLQYNYMYDYRHNYYNDVIDYLDRRQNGVGIEPPRAQTWAERVLRTYITRSRNSAVSTASRADSRLLSHISSGARFHRYHSKSLISRKYSDLGFVTMTI